MIAGCVPCELLKHFDVQLSSGAITAIKMAYYGVVRQPVYNVAEISTLLAACAVNAAALINRGP